MAEETNDDLTQLERQSQKKKPICSLCGRELSRPWTLERHLIKIHGLEETSIEVTAARKTKSECRYCRVGFTR